MFKALLFDNVVEVKLRSVNRNKLGWTGKSLVYIFARLSLRTKIVARIRFSRVSQIEKFVVNLAFCGCHNTIWKEIEAHLGWGWGAKYSRKLAKISRIWRYNIVKRLIVGTRNSETSNHLLPRKIFLWCINLTIPMSIAI